MKQYTVKITFPYKQWPLLRQTPNWSGEWGDYKFIIDDDLKECDFWVIFTDFDLKKETCLCSQANTIFIPGEPNSVAKFTDKFLKQFGLIITCQDEIVTPNASHYLEGHPWFINKSYDELVNLEPIKKTKKISLITSNKTETDGHKKRLDFAYNLKDYFKDEVDLFGRGIQQFDDKWDVLAPYKYSITMENSNYDDYLSEKFYDCHLSYTYPIYYGCPNASKYFFEKSFSRINIDNFDESVKVIESILNDENFYESRLQYIQTERLKVLNEYNLFPLLVSYLKKMDGNAKPGEITIAPAQSFKKLLSQIKKLILK
jgi:hypothetical protein